MNLLENIVTDMTPEEFEVYCLQLLEDISKEFPESTFQHNKIEKAHDGDYQLDGYIEFKMFGVEYKTIVECKKYKSKIKRSQIQILHNTMQNIGAHKGIFISTSSYQKGAMNYAKIHGIALLQVIDGRFMYVQNSVKPIKFVIRDIPQYVCANYNLKLQCPTSFVYKDKLGIILEYLKKV